MFILHNALTIKPIADLCAKAPAPEKIEELYDGKGRHLMVESVTLDDIERTYFDDMDTDEHGAMMLEAITTSKMRLERTMSAFAKALNQQLQGTNLQAGAPELGRVRKTGGVAIMPAVMSLSDGQSITVMFHSPTNDPSKISTDDTLVAFRFLLNKRDVTHVVSPDGGKDISLKQTCLSLANLAEKNTAKFQAAQERANKLKTDLENYRAQAAQLDEQAAQLIDQGDKLKAKEDGNQAELATITAKADKQEQLNNELRKQLEAAQAKAKAASEGATTPPAAAGNGEARKTLELAKKAIQEAYSHQKSADKITATIERRGESARLTFNRNSYYTMRTKALSQAEELFTQYVQQGGTAADWDAGVPEEMEGVASYEFMLAKTGAQPAAQPAGTTTPPAGTGDDSGQESNLVAEAMKIVGDAATPADITKQEPEEFIRSSMKEQLLDEGNYFADYVQDMGGDVEKALYAQLVATIDGKETLESLKAKAYSWYKKEVMDLPRDTVFSQEMMRGAANNPDVEPSVKIWARKFDNWDENLSGKAVMDSGDNVTSALVKERAKAKIKELIADVAKEILPDGLQKMANATGDMAAPQMVKNVSVPMPSLAFDFCGSVKPSKSYFKKFGVIVSPDMDEDGNATGFRVTYKGNTQVFTGWSAMKETVFKLAGVTNESSTASEPTDDQLIADAKAFLGNPPKPSISTQSKDEYIKSVMANLLELEPKEFLINAKRYGDVEHALYAHFYEAVSKGDNTAKGWSLIQLKYVADDVYAELLQEYKADNGGDDSPQKKSTSKELEQKLDAMQFGTKELKDYVPAGLSGDEVKSQLSAISRMYAHMDAAFRDVNALFGKTTRERMLGHYFGFDDYTAHQLANAETSGTDLGGTLIAKVPDNGSMLDAEKLANGEYTKSELMNMFGIKDHSKGTGDDFEDLDGLVGDMAKNGEVKHIVSELEGLRDANYAGLDLDGVMSKIADVEAFINSLTELNAYAENEGLVDAVTERLANRMLELE